MSLAARYEIRPGTGWPRLTTAGAASLSLAAHVLLVAAVLYPWSVSVHGPPPSIDVTLISIQQRQVATISPSLVRPPTLDRMSAAAPAPAVPAVIPVPEAFPIPPAKPAPPEVARQAAPAVVAHVAVASPTTAPRRDPVATPLVMAWAESKPLPPQQVDVQARDFAALAAKMPGSTELPTEPVAQGPIVDADLVAGLQPEYPIASRLWSSPGSPPGRNQAARLLVDDPQVQNTYYSEDTIRKILNGSYSASKRLGIPGQPGIDPRAK